MNFFVYGYFGFLIINSLEKRVALAVFHHEMHEFFFLVNVEETHDRIVLPEGLILGSLDLD